MVCQFAICNFHFSTRNPIRRVQGRCDRNGRRLLGKTVKTVQVTPGSASTHINVGVNESDNAPLTCPISHSALLASCVVLFSGPMQFAVYCHSQRAPVSRRRAVRL